MRQQSTQNLRQSPIAILEMDIGDQIHHLRVYPDDDIKLLARIFCQKHNLNQQGCSYIIENIQNKLKQNHQETILNKYQSQTQISRSKPQFHNQRQHLPSNHSNQSQDSQEQSPIKNIKNKAILQHNYSTNNITENQKHTNQSESTIQNNPYLYQQKYKPSILVIPDTKYNQNTHTSNITQQSNSISDPINKRLFHQLPNININQQTFSSKESNSKISKSSSPNITYSKLQNQIKQIQNQNQNQHQQNQKKIKQWNISRNQKPSPSKSNQSGKSKNLQNGAQYFQKLRELFRKLDGKNEGMISSSNICIESISVNDLEKIKCVLYNMESKQQKLNEEQFLKECLGMKVKME